MTAKTWLAAFVVLFARIFFLCIV